MSKPICEPPLPVLDWIGIAEDRFHPDFAVRTNLDRASRHVVCP